MRSSLRWGRVEWGKSTARDTRLDRTVAIKILPSHFADDATRRQRFERGAKLISSLNHPNICTLYDVGRHDGIDFIVMEYLEGESLAERLEKGPLSPPRVIQFGIQIASALDKAHRNGVTHRDLKPSNISLTKIRRHGNPAKLGDNLQKLLACWRVKRRFLSVPQKCIENLAHASSHKQGGLWRALPRA